MQSLSDYTFKRHTFTAADPRPESFEVIICTIGSGRVRRKRFKDWGAATEYADKWRGKNKSKITFRVSIERLGG